MKKKIGIIFLILTLTFFVNTAENYARGNGRVGERVYFSFDIEHDVPFEALINVVATEEMDIQANVEVYGYENKIGDGYSNKYVEGPYNISGYFIPEKAGKYIVNIDVQIKDKNGNFDRIQSAPQFNIVSEEESKEETEEITETEIINYGTIYKDAPEIYEGESKIEREGINGKQIVTYIITKLNGEVISKERKDNPEIIKEPVDQIVLVGKKANPNENQNTKLKYISIEGGKLANEFDENLFSYLIELDENIKELVFDAQPQDDEADIEGLGRVDISKNSEHKIIVKSPKGATSIYRFSWGNSNSIFKFIKEDGSIIELIYDNDNLEKFTSLTNKEIKIEGKSFKGYVDKNNIQIVPLKSKDKENTGWYVVKNGKILKKLSSVLVVQRVIYQKSEFIKLSENTLTKFNLEISIVPGLNIEGYKIDKKNYSGVYFIRLNSVDDKAFWYEYNISGETLIQLNFQEAITEEALKTYFGIKNTSMFSGIRYRHIAYIVIGINLLIILIYIVYSLVKKYKKK